MVFNPLNVELNPICHLLALLGAHHILHVSRIRIKDPYSRVKVQFDLEQATYTQRGGSRGMALLFL